MIDESRVMPFSGVQINCALCGSSNISSRREKHTFSYGEERAAVSLSVEIPTHKCLECGFEFTDSEADELRHEAVCRYLGVMTPAEIRRIRERLGLSKAEFSRKSGIGEASINRWERGAVIQNAAMDRYLYLLSIDGNLDALARKEHLDGWEGGAPHAFQYVEMTPALRERAKKFRL